MSLTKVSYSMINGASVNVLDFGAVGDGTTDSTLAFQDAFDALTSGGQLVIPKGTYKLTNTITVSNDNVSVCCVGNLTWTTLGASKNGLTIDANDFLWEGGIVSGPSVAAYVSNERFISMIGTSTSSRKTGLKVYNAEIYNFGAYGIYAQFVDDIVIKNNNIHDVGYSGASFLSCNHGNFETNKIKNITPGTVGNAYGVSLTHDSTNYSTDPNAGTKLATNPFCWDWYVAGNHVEEILWEGIDCHGGYEICITGNHIYATYGGIACSSSSGDATDYAGSNNSITNNVIDAANSDGTVSGYENDNYGINLNGGSVVNHTNVICTGNVVKGHGVLGNINSGSIQSLYVTVGTVADNIVEKWGGNAIYAGSSSLINITGNSILQLGGASAGAEIGINLAGVSSEGDSFNITNNTISANGGTAALIGFRGLQLTTLPYFSGNDFSASPTPFALPAAFAVGTDGLPTYSVTVNNAGSGETIDIAPMNRYSQFQILVTSSNAASVITNLTNARRDQIVYLYSPGTTAWIFNQSNAALGGGANFTASQYDSLVLRNINNTSTIKWIEISRSINS
jgi:hypothetical protein